MKQLYWIDDDFGQMLYVAQGAIQKLWKLNDRLADGIHSKVILFGNAYESMDSNEVPTKEDETYALGRLRKLFKDACMSIDGPNRERPLFNAKKELIRDMVCYLYKKEIPGDSHEYIKMKEAWISGKLDTTDTDDYKNAIKEANLLVEKMHIEPGSVAGIDIMLLYGDSDRLVDGKQILSMELYHILSENNIRCFLYSSDAGVDEYRQKWIKKYESLYKKDNVLIYQRTDFMRRGDADIVKEIENMFEEEQRDTEGKDNGDKNIVV